KKAGEDQAIRRSRGGLTTKIHAMVGALGNPVGFSLTPGQASDLGQAEPLLDQVDPQALLADKAYDRPLSTAAITRERKSSDMALTMPAGLHTQPT
ncbi:hypothetical protein X729_30830, partial [Mesorhizobium sp. L103C131B0]